MIANNLNKRIMEDKIMRYQYVFIMTETTYSRLNNDLNTNNNINLIDNDVIAIGTLYNKTRLFG